MISALHAGAIAVVSLTLGALPAQTPRLVRDVNATPPVVSSAPGPFATSGPYVWFPATVAATGRELFAVDLARLALVRAEDVVPGPVSSSPGLLTPFAGGVLFAASVGSGHELRFAHPAGPGTARLWAGSEVLAIRVAGPLAFFSVRSGTSGELWRTDGTPAGTRLLRTFLLRVTELAPVGSALFFAATDPVTGTELWRSDGTVAGTALFADLVPGAPSSHPRSIVSGGGVLWFVASTSVGVSVWRSDGTVAGTTSVHVGLADELTAVGPNLFFVDNGWHLWFTDGTPAGTRQVAQLFQRTGRQFAADGTRLWFTDGGLLISDGTVAGTRRLATGTPVDHGLSAAGGRVFVVLDDDLWGSDGTVLGTTRVRAGIDRGQSRELPQGLALTATSGGRAFFVGRDVVGDEPWTSDGTTPGTVRILDLHAPPPGSTTGSQPPLAWYGSGPGAGPLLMPRDDGVHGVELWRTDGTAAGTSLVRDLTPGSESTAFSGFVVQGDTAWFTTVPNAGLPAALWRTDGTAAGTLSVLTAQALRATQLAVAGPVLRGGVLLLWVDDRVWASDGTAAGSTALGLPPNSFASTFYLGGDPEVAFFGTMTGEAWRTDGTAAGTSLVVPSVPNGSQQVHHLGAFRGGHLLRVYTEVPSPSGTLRTTLFRIVDMPASVPVSFPDSGNGAVFDDRILILAGNDLLVWDGIAPAVRIAAFASTGGPAGSFPLLRLDNAALFLADDGVHGTEPWWTDGTAAGTRMITDLHPGPSSTDAYFAIPLRDRAVLWLDMPGVGSEPWGTDGTAAGSAMIGDLEPGSGSSAPGFNGVFVGARRAMVAVATTTRGNEPWITDGTPAGSRFVADVWPGPESSMDTFGPYGAVVGGALVFDADDGLRGAEPWVLDVEGVATAVDVPCARVPAFYVNDPVLGRTWEMRVPWMPAGSFGLTLVGRPAAQPVALGGGCFLHVDPGSLAVLTAIVPNAQGAWSFALPLPNAPALVGVHVAVQPVFAPSSSPLGIDPGQAWSAVLGR